MAFDPATPRTQDVLQWALALPEADRAVIADCLLESIHPDDVEAEGAPSLHPDWDAEIARRVAEIKAGRAKMVPWEDVNREAKEIIRRAQNNSL
jgi:putative addiction module component (TIGR02574 family)